MKRPVAQPTKLQHGLPFVFRVAALLCLGSCRPALPDPVLPLSATPLGALGNAPHVEGESKTALPAISKGRLASGLSVHMIESARAKPFLVALTLPDARGGDCRAETALVTAAAWQQALRGPDGPPGAWFVTWNGLSMELSAGFATDDTGAAAKALETALHVVPHETTVEQARRRLASSVAARDLGGPHLALALLKQWQMALPVPAPAQLLEVTSTDVHGCMRQALTPRTAQLAIASAAPSGLPQGLERHLSDFRTTTKRPPTTATPISSGERLRVVHRKVAITSLAAAIVGPPIDHPDYPAFSLVAELFGGGAHSRLQQALRDRLGLTYWTSAGMWHLPDRSVLGVITEIDHDRLNAALDALEDEVASLRDLRRDELEAVRSALREQRVAELERPERAVLELARLGLHFESPGEALQAWLSALDRLTPAQVQHIAHEYFRVSSTPIVIVCDKTLAISQLQWRTRKYELLDLQHTPAEAY